MVEEFVNHIDISDDDIQRFKVFIVKILLLKKKKGQLFPTSNRDDFMYGLL